MSLAKSLEAPYDEMAERGYLFNTLKEHYTADAEKDCTAAVLAADEEQVTSALIDLGNIARRLRTSSDTDDKIEFINYVCMRTDVIIAIYANEKAELAVERGDDTSDQHVDDKSVDDILAMDCPDCGRPCRGLSICEHCGYFIGMSFPLPNKKVKE